ncbi:transcriptional regulator, MarR family [Chloroherpeton thalassium ATCC 35110]|uniref:Transcriptional regulator, MarR family n=1 Tax=Chloroherpeton thalassium (strain ATCC 35110 / GB-78) TaxID=517418 RepID=B3QSX7_CHLT3|nr:MarR family transcriptional regulator [Chloroherpeton thalassium]ACF12620.1 transcriptional regulator, MarR family [Chloroherpeton thalassium ATCC 35110]
MKLEEEIQQKEFDSAYHKAAVNIMYTYHWLHEKFSQALKSEGITTQQYNILRILRGQYPNPSTIYLLRDRMLDKQSDTSRLVKRLAQKGLVKRDENEQDKRKIDVLISPLGLELLHKLDVKVNRVIEGFSYLNKKDAECLNSLLDKFREEV